MTQSANQKTGYNHVYDTHFHNVQKYQALTGSVTLTRLTFHNGILDKNEYIW